MTADEVANRVVNICREIDDDEKAHALEDSLWFDVLSAIAGGADNARELATEAIRTSKLAFNRWCA